MFLTLIARAAWHRSHQQMQACLGRTPTVATIQIKTYDADDIVRLKFYAKYTMGPYKSVQVQAGH
jgi:hypothetical protein